MKLSRREKILLVLVLLIGGAAAYIFLFLQPCLNEISRFESQNRTNLGIIQTNTILKESIDEITKGLIDDVDKLAQFGDNVNAAFDQPPVAVYLFETMNKYGEKVLISFGEFGNLGKVNSSSVNVTMNGTYEALKNVMKEFSEGEYFVKVISLSISSLAPSPTSGEQDTTSPLDNSTDGMISINMSLEFYNIGYSIPPDKTYPFTGGAVQYGGDIFH